MTETFSSAQSTAAAAEVATGPGAALLKARRDQSLSLGDVSRQLKLSVRQVEAIERDDFSGLKNAVFIHGFIRNYAKLLHLDPDPLIQAADLKLAPPALPVPDQREPDDLPLVRVKVRKNWAWSAVAVLVIAILALSAYIGRGRHSEPVSNISSASPASVAAEKMSGPDVKAAANVEPVQAPPEPEPEPKPKPAVPPKVAVKAESKPKLVAKTETQPAADAVAPVAAGAAAARVTVRMIFDEQSWVEIKDGTGKSIFGQLNAAGSRRSVSGEPPLSIVVGHAAGVRMFRDDRALDLAPHTQVDVARLTLN